MGALRVALAVFLVGGILASGATAVSANDTPNAEEPIAPGPGLADLKQAIDEFRAAIAELRDACRAERESLPGAVTTARKRGPRVETECERTLRELKAQFQTMKQQALELEARYVAGVKQQRLEAAKEKEAAAKEKLEQARREEQARAEQAKKAAQPAKPVAAPSPAEELAKKRKAIESQLAQVASTIAYKQELLKRAQAAAAEYRTKAATLTGAERERALAKAAQADQEAAQWTAYLQQLAAQRDQLTAALAKLGTAASPAPKPEPTVTLRAKLEAALKELNEKIAYTWSGSDRYAAYANELRTQAAVATSDAQRAELLAKAARADAAADEWAGLARQYEDQREAVQQQLDALPRTP
jgi:hypothetical protein